MPYGIRKCLPDHVVDRLNNAVTLCKPDLAFYSISMLPTVLAWGPGEGTSIPTDESRFVVEPKGVVRVLLIGEVTKSFLRGTSTNRGSCSLNILPIFQAERERVEDLVKGFATSSKGLLFPFWTVRDAHSSRFLLVKAMKSDISKAGVMVSAAIGVVSLCVSHSCPAEQYFCRTPYSNLSTMLGKSTARRAKCHR